MKRSKLLFISGILGTLYLIYLILYFAGGLESPFRNNMEEIAAAAVIPHMICVGAAVLFNWIGCWIGWTKKARWAALFAGIFYTAALLCLVIHALFVAVQIILCFAAFAKGKREVQNFCRIE